MAKRSGGGITSKNLVHKPVKTGKPALKDNVKAVSQIGQSLGNKATDHSKMINSVERLRQGALGAMGNVELGNARAQSCPKGPGGGRTIYRSGTQSAPTTRAMPATKDTLAEFGRESPGVMNRK
jgi:hypothetical protein